MDDFKNEDGLKNNDDHKVKMTSKKEDNLNTKTA